MTSETLAEEDLILTHNIPSAASNESMSSFPTTKAMKVTNYTVGYSNSLPFSSYHTGLITFSVLVILSNIFAISTYWRHKTIRKNLSNVLLFSLAVSDLLIGLVYLPVLVVCERSDFEQYKWLDTLSRYHHLLGNLCGFSTVFHIIALTVDKYIAVLYPFKKINLSTRWLYRKTLIALWTTALLFALIPLSWLFKDERTASWYKKLHIYGIFQLVIFFGVSLIILVFCYCRMFAKIRQKHCDASSLTGSRVQRRVRTDRKTILMLLCFFAVFVIGWFPWFLFTLDNKTLRIPVEVKDFLVTLRYAGAFLNPFIYAFLKNDYRQAIKSDLAKLCPRSPAMLELLQLKNINDSTWKPNRSQDCQEHSHRSQKSYYDTATLSRRTGKQNCPEKMKIQI